MDNKDMKIIQDMNKRLNILENRVSELHEKLYQEKKEEFFNDNIITQEFEEEKYCDR